MQPLLVCRRSFRTACIALDWLSNPDQRDDGDKNHRREQEDVVDANHRCLCIEAALDDAGGLLLAEPQCASQIVRHLGERGAVGRDMLGQLGVMHDAAVIPGSGRDRGANGAAEHPHKTRQTRCCRDFLRW